MDGEIQEKKCRVFGGELVILRCRKASIIEIKETAITDDR